MSSIPNINWNDPNNGKSNTSRQSQPQPQLPSNVSPPNSRAVPTSGSIGGPQYGSSQFSNEYSRNPNTIGGPPFPLQSNQRGYMPNTGYPQVHSQQQQQQQQPLYQQYPPQSHYNLQQRQQAQGQQLKSQLNEQNAMMSASTQQYPVQDFTNPYPNAQNPAEQQQQQQPLRTQSQQWDGYQSQPLYSAAGNTIPSSIQQQIPPQNLSPSEQQQVKQQQPSPPEQGTKKKPGRKPKLRKLSESSSETPQFQKQHPVLRAHQSQLRLNCTWPKPGTEHKNKPKDQKDDENTIEHAEFGRIKVLRGIVEYRSK
ncbi:hypothetical protein FOB64_001403 [Candida albicans]|uniref:Uncharacterized protein n=1 Tax=Candida albicans TaxID=5476 RepID=A0A8H6F569_CANAX|nr:hypothetical protein FOB64_001403 [Candida albicans]